MSKTTTHLPAWLHKSLKDHTHLAHTLTVLADRENTRDEARSATRHQAHSRGGGGGMVRAHLPSPAAALFARKVPDAHMAHYSVELGSRPEHLPQNRYLAVEPFGRTRVTVDNDENNTTSNSNTNSSNNDGGEGGHYLNANWVRELHGGQWWIASQAPLPNTVHRFLSLFLQPETRPPHHLCPPDALPPPGPCRLRTAVQLTLTHEGGRTKAHAYFPTALDASFVIPAPEDSPDSSPRLKITLQAQTSSDDSHSVVSTLRLVRCRSSDNSEYGDVVHFTHLLFTHWPDFGIPETPEEKRALLKFARLVAMTNRDLTSCPPSAHPDPPIMVNCSAGIGRTGSFIALCSLLRSHGLLLPDYPPLSKSAFPPLPEGPQGPLPDEIADDEVASEIDSLREQRAGMVQRTQQQLIVYELLQAAYNDEIAKSKASSSSSRQK